MCVAPSRAQGRGVLPGALGAMIGVHPFGVQLGAVKARRCRISARGYPFGRHAGRAGGDAVWRFRRTAGLSSLARLSRRGRFFRLCGEVVVRVRRSGALFCSYKVTGVVSCWSLYRRGLSLCSDSGVLPRVAWSVRSVRRPACLLCRSLRWASLPALTQSRCVWTLWMVWTVWTVWTLWRPIMRPRHFSRRWSVLRCPRRNCPYGPAHLPFWK